MKKSERIAVAGAAVLTLIFLVPPLVAQEHSAATEDSPSEVEASAEESAPTNTTEPGATTQPAEEKPESAKPHSYYVSRAVSTHRETDPPGYVRNGAQIAEWFGDEQADDWRWLDFGIEQNTRYEHRQNFYIANLENDNRFLMRNRAYFGIHEIADPFRFGFEFQDARAFGNDFPETTGDVDENDILQAYGELYFKDALGPKHPLSFRAGRMSMDLVDRRMIARNGFRNSTNAFDGFRVRAGDDTTVWDVNIVAMQPVERRVRQLDRTDEERWVYGITGAFRGLDPVAIFEPYYLVLDEDRKGFNAFDRELHTFGLHTFGLIGDTGFDYDTDIIWQTGKSRRQNQRGFAAHGELGYTFEHDWQPRLAAFGDYASGDRHPWDNTNERFDRYFGASHMFYAPTDQFIFENLIQSGLRLSAKPLKKLRFDGFYRAYWLASDSDSWGQTGRRDRAGRSGDFIGHGFDVLMAYDVTSHFTIEIGYAHLTVGDFIANTNPPGDDSDFFYVQTRLKF